MPKIDMSPGAVTARLMRTSELRQLGLEVGRGALPAEKSRRTGSQPQTARSGAARTRDRVPSSERGD